MKKAFLLIMIGSLALGFMAGQAIAAEKVRMLFTTTSYGVWYNEMSICLQKAQGGLGFFEQEGLDVEHSGASGSGDAIKIVGAGQAEVAGMAGYGPMIISIDNGMPVISPWNINLKNIFFIIVPETSPIKDIKELKGKKIGVYSYGSDGVPMAKAMAKEAGLDPEKDIELVPIGLGAQAVDALKKGTVAAGSYWDTGIALMEVEGIKFRYLSTPGVQNIYSSGYTVNVDWLKKNRATAVKFFRGIAKADVFIKTNPAASVKVHWKVFPASKPTEDEAKSLKDMTHVLNARLRTVKDPSDTSMKYGWMDKKMWEDTIDFYIRMDAIKNRIPVEKVFTNDLINEANSFDMKPVIEMAKSYK